MRSSLRSLARDCPLALDLVDRIIKARYRTDYRIGSHGFLQMSIHFCD